MALPLLVAALFAVWTVAGLRPLLGSLARNAGFLAYNNARNSQQPDSETAQRAAAFLEQATKLNPADTSAWRALGYARLSLDEEEGAVAAWRQTETMATELLTMGQAAEDAGDNPQALRWYERAITVAPATAEAWLRAGTIYEVQGDANQAMAVYRDGASAAPANSDLLYRMAEIAIQQPAPVDWGAVLALVDRAIAQDNYLHEWSRLRSHFLRGESLLYLGREAEALAEFTALAARQPVDYVSLVRYGELTWKLKGDLEEADRVLRQAIAGEPDIKWAYISLAWVYDEAGHQATAAALYARVLELDPDDRAANRWFEQQ
ncbi:tetratricopeptide repeat protein [Candidatus Promineifilum breve]|uniref:tetratricopeptide repeat protein n=1 Tax=Candidatus Promineifilum breve TaxID=1806508 RepID=UPI0013901787|nr:tetratricopeptide repeat protein [Candidatus Promineifilum breve]